MRESPPSFMTVKTASAACAPAADSEADLLRSLHPLRSFRWVTCLRYSQGEFVEDVNCACAREAVPFDNDIFNELVS